MSEHANHCEEGWSTNPSIEVLGLKQEFQQSALDSRQTDNTGGS